VDAETCDRCGKTIDRLEDAFVTSEPLEGGDSLVCRNCLRPEEMSAIEGDETAFWDEIARSEEWHA